MDPNLLLVYVWGSMFILFSIYTIRKFLKRDNQIQKKSSILTIEQTRSNNYFNNPTKEIMVPKPQVSHVRAPVIVQEYNVKLIKGIGPKYANQLKEMNIINTSHLFKEGSNIHGIKKISESTGINEKLIQKWVSNADLLRVQGIITYLDLLERANIKNVYDLSQSESLELYKLLLKINGEKKIVPRSPSLEMISRWIRLSKDILTI
jgi:hypothetical protein